MSKANIEDLIIDKSVSRYNIPDNWFWTKLGNITRVESGGTPKTSVKEYFEDGDIPWITPADLSGYKEMYISKGNRNITELGLKESSAKLLPKNTVVMSSRAPIGYVAIAKNNLATNQGFKNFVPSNAIEPRYLYWYLKSSKSYIESLASGTTFKEISGSKCKEIEIPVPPIEEQRRIVKRVESLLTGLNQAKQLIEEAKETFQLRRAAILDKAFRGKLTSKWREENKGDSVDNLLKKIREQGAEKNKLKNDELDPLIANSLFQLPVGWRWVRLFEITQSSVFGSSAKASEDSSGVPVIRMGNITNGKIIIDNLKYLPHDHQDVKKYTLEENDLLFNRTNSLELVGKTAVVDATVAGRVTFASYLIKVSLYLKDILAYYVCNYINSHIGRNILLSMATQQVGQANINSTKLLSLPVPLPPENELLEISKIIRSLIEGQESTLESLELDTYLQDISQTILQKAFRGELGTNDPNEESALELLKELLEQSI